MKTAEPKSQAEGTHSWSPNSKNKAFFHFNQLNIKPFFGPATIQPKLKIGESDDKYEQQADRVADTVVQMKDSEIQRQSVEEEEEELQMKQEPILQRKCKECEEEEKLQRKHKVQTKSADSSGNANINPLFETTEPKYKQFEPRVMTSVQETASEPMVMGDWKAWIGNGEVVNNSSRDVTVWSSDNGTYTIPAHSRSASWGEDVDHVRDIHGQWWKIGWNTAVVDSNGEVSGAKCRSPGRGQDCGQLGDYPAPRQEDQIHAKLKVNQPNDPFEQEADAMAEKVVNGEASIQRKCTACKEVETLQRQPEEEEEKLQGKSLAQLKTASLDGGKSTSPWMEQQINSSRGSGQPLPKHTRGFMENGIGSGFQKVKVHTDNNAVQMNRELGARAFTVGHDIYFNEGEYNPASNSGKHLLAHELTHVVQQNGVQHAPVQRSCFDGNCEDCAGGMRDLWVTVFFARRANRETMQNLRTAINGAKSIFRNCCINIKFDFNWTLIPNAATIESSSLHRRPAGDPSGLFDVPEPVESIGEGQLVAGSRGIPMLVVDEIRGTGGGTTILGGQDDQGRDFDVEYTGPSMFFIAVNQPNPNGNCNHIAHEVWHITGALRHTAAEGGITACTNNDVSETYCNAVRGLV